MSDKYSGETKVCNWLHNYLITNEYNVIQLISPGAQATLSIRYDSKQSNRKKIVYPDLIAFRSNKIILGEVKENFSKADKIKLLDIMNSENGKEKIKTLINRVTRHETSDFEIIFMLIHCDNNTPPDSQISQLILNEESGEII